MAKKDERPEIKEEKDAEVVHQAELREKAETERVKDVQNKAATASIAPTREEAGPTAATGASGPADPLQQILNERGWYLEQFGDRWTVRVDRDRTARTDGVGTGSSPREAIDQALRNVTMPGPTGPTGPTGIAR